MIIKNYLWLFYQINVSNITKETLGGQTKKHLTAINITEII